MPKFVNTLKANCAGCNLNPKSYNIEPADGHPTHTASLFKLLYETGHSFMNWSRQSWRELKLFILFRAPEQDA